MSFDLKLVNGDLSLGSNGDLERVFDVEKLKQDLLKIMITPTNSNKNYPWYGSPLTARTIGQTLDPEILDSEIENSLVFAINNLRVLQQEQERDGQFITPPEAIARILGITVDQDVFDARMFNIRVSVETRRGSIVNETLVLTT